MTAETETLAEELARLHHENEALRQAADHLADDLMSILAPYAMGDIPASAAALRRIAGEHVVIVQGAHRSLH